MFFFNGRIRNPHVVPIVTNQRTYTHKINYSGIITSCLSIIIGIMFIVIGLISETEKTAFFTLGICCLSFACFITTLICFYKKLVICYHNWIYGQPITPCHAENSLPATAGDVAISYCASPTAIIQTKRLPSTSAAPNKPVRMSSPV